MKKLYIILLVVAILLFASGLFFYFLWNKSIPCNSTYDCPSGQVCSKQTNTCYAHKGGIDCDTDDDCPYDSHCDQKLKICMFPIN